MGFPQLSTRATRIALVPLAAALCALVALVVVGGAGAAGSANSVNFPDSTGEDPQGPDIVSVAVANDDQGNITFTVNMPGRPTLTEDMAVLIFVDADANPATGEADSLGTDYVIQLAGPLGGPAGVGIFRWNGTDYSGLGVPQTSLIFSYANGSAVIRINASELGGTKRFNFAVIAFTGFALTPSGELDDTNVRADVAPDAGHGLHTYDVKTTPPSLVVRSSGSTPARPRAGKRYTVFAVVARKDTGALVQSGRVTCRATVGGRAVRGTPRLARGRASCTFSIPASAAGKTIRGSIGVASQGLSARRSFSAKIAA